MSDFKNLIEVLSHVEESLVIDLLPYARVVGSDENIGKLFVEPEVGIYLAGDAEPLFKQDSSYFIRDRTTGNFVAIPKPYTVTSTLLVRADIYNSKGEVVARDTMLQKVYRLLSEHPTTPVMAIRAAIATVDHYLTTVSRHTNRRFPQYRFTNLLKPSPEANDFIEKDEFMHAYEHLLDKVTDFVDGKHWNLYHLSVKGNSLIVQRGIDHRIYCYYQQIFKENAEE